LEFTASQIAGILEGEVEGNPEIAVHKLAKIEEGEKGSLTFLANPKYTQYIYSTEASITIVNKDFIPEQTLTTTLIKVQDAYKSFSKLLAYYNQVKFNKTGIEAPVFISESASYGADFYMGAFSYLGNNVAIGNNVKIFPNVYIGDNVSIADNVIVFAGAKIYSETIRHLTRDLPIHGLAHVTGGGIEDNLLRIIPRACQVLLQKRSWEVPAIFDFLQEAGKISDEEMLRTFNNGIGLVAVVPDASTIEVMSRLSALNEKAFVIGEVAECRQQNNRCQWM